MSCFCSGPEPTNVKLPDKDSIKATVEAFKAGLSVSAEVEHKTGQKQSSPLWYMPDNTI